VDIRVESFVPEAAGRPDFLCAEYGFTGLEVVPDEAEVYPLMRRVRATSALVLPSRSAWSSRT
jgi:hypothetical protein